MELLRSTELLPVTPRRVSYFRMTTAFLERLLDLPKDTRIVSVQTNGDCSALNIRVAGESVPEHGPNWCLTPLVRRKKGTAEDGSIVEQIEFVSWDGYDRLKAEQDAKTWYERHGKEPQEYSGHIGKWRWRISDSTERHSKHEMPDAVFDRLSGIHKSWIYETREAAEADALRAIRESIEAGQLT